jgi:hypothetical protein
VKSLQVTSLKKENSSLQLIVEVLRHDLLPDSLSSLLIGEARIRWGLTQANIVLILAGHGSDQILIAPFDEDRSPFVIR